MIGAQVLEQGHAEEISRGARGGHGYAEDGVGTQLRLVLCPVQLDHGVVDVDLFQRVQPDHLGGDHVVDVLDRLLHALAEEPGLVAVPELNRLVLARGCARRHGRPTHGAVFKDDVNLHRRVAP